jgi:hypothetical protein
MKQKIHPGGNPMKPLFKSMSELAKHLEKLETRITAYSAESVQ